MYEEILFPTDGSKATVEALDHALAVARAHDARIHVLYVIDKRHYIAAEEEAKDDIRATLEEEGARAIDDAQVRIEDEGIACNTEITDGVPHTAIVEYIGDHDIDMVVMGTHGKTGREQLATLGSTTERVVKRATTPVLVVELS